MSATLCLTMALAGAYDCPTGNPAYTGYPVYGSYSYGMPAYQAPQAGGYGYAAPGPQTRGYAPRPYGGQPAYGSGAGGYPMQPQAGYGVPGPQSSPQRGNVVQMTDRARFEPAQITVNVGETVEWRNASRQAHTVTADPNLASNSAHVVLPQGAQPIHSGEVRPGGRFTYTFETPGIYYYVCLPHEEMGMVGIVVVRERQGGAQAGAGAAGGRAGGY